MPVGIEQGDFERAMRPITSVLIADDVGADGDESTKGSSDEAPHPDELMAELFTFRPARQSFAELALENGRLRAMAKKERGRRFFARCSMRTEQEFRDLSKLESRSLGQRAKALVFEQPTEGLF
jgi:hypothetical protein